MGNLASLSYWWCGFRMTRRIDPTLLFNETRTCIIVGREGRTANFVLRSIFLYSPQYTRGGQSKSTWTQTRITSSPAVGDVAPLHAHSCVPVFVIQQQREKNERFRQNNASCTLPKSYVKTVETRNIASLSPSVSLSPFLSCPFSLSRSLTRVKTIKGAAARICFTHVSDDHRHRYSIQRNRWVRKPSTTHIPSSTPAGSTSCETLFCVYYFWQ